LLVPGSFGALHDDLWFQACDDRINNARLHLNFTEPELPQAEWDQWLQFQREQLAMVDPVVFWSSRPAAWLPSIQRIALYLISAPAVVTTCDSVISVMGSMFTTRQARMNEATAADLIALRCNGMPQHGIDGSIHKKKK
jgi:hypothetical protein